MPLLAHWAECQPDKAAAHFPDAAASLTYGALHERAERVARWLIAQGLRPDDAIALLLDNRPEYLEIVEGARRAGLHWVPLSIHLRPKEVAYVLRDCAARLLLVSPALASLAAELASGGVTHGLIRAVVGGAPLPGHAALEPALAAIDLSVPRVPGPLGRVFLYSSGTTGLPKGIRRPLIPWEARDTPEWDTTWRTLYGFDDRTVYLSPAPLYHAAPHAYVQRTLATGGTVVVPHRFDAATVLALIAHHRVTHSQWVPTMFVRLLALPAAERERHDLSMHRCAIHAAAPCPPAVKRAMIDWWGPILCEYYGGSEGIGTTAIDSAEWLAHPGSVGRPLNGATVHITDELTGALLPPGEVGVVRFAGGPPFAYHNAPEKTAASHDAAGRATLGDLGWLDRDGWLYLSDRRADLILSGGVNLYPAEIEAVLATHPDVAEVAVVGVPDAEMGERVAAAVVLRTGVVAGPTLEAELSELARAELAGPKRPRTWVFVEELPRSEAGKLLRRRLKERFATA